MNTNMLLVGIIDLRYSRNIYKLNGCTNDIIRNISVDKSIVKVVSNSYDNYNKEEIETYSNERNNVFILQDVSKGILCYMYSSIGSTTNLILRNMCVMHRLTVFNTTNLRKSMTTDLNNIILSDFVYGKTLNRVSITFRGDIEVNTVRYDGPLGSVFRQQIGIITSPKLSIKDYPGYII